METIITIFAALVFASAILYFSLRKPKGGCGGCGGNCDGCNADRRSRDKPDNR